MCFKDHKNINVNAEKRKGLHFASDLDIYKKQTLKEIKQEESIKALKRFLHNFH